MLHFPKQEFDRRISRAREAMAEAQLDGLILFRQESMFYLTGYDTSGYSMFQAMYLGLEDGLTLLTRTRISPGRRQWSMTFGCGLIRKMRPRAWNCDAFWKNMAVPTVGLELSTTPMD